MRTIEGLIESLLACNIKDVFTLSNDSLIGVLAAFEKSNFNIHCLYSEENIPIAAGACAPSQVIHCCITFRWLFSQQIN